MDAEEITLILQCGRKQDKYTKTFKWKCYKNIHKQAILQKQNVRETSSSFFLENMINSHLKFTKAYLHNQKSVIKIISLKKWPS